MPTILSWAFLDGIVERSLEIVSVPIKYLSSAFYMIGCPNSFYFRSVSEIDCSLSMFFAVKKVSMIDGAIAIKICSLSILFPLFPWAIIAISVGIEHFADAMFEIIFPVAFIYIAISIVILTFPLLAIFNVALKAFSIFKNIGPID